jgi:GT2 family glycosyltransferase
MNISLIIALRNNLDYNKHFYSTTRLLYPDVEICFSSYGSTDGTHEWLEEIASIDLNVKIFYSNKTATFSDNYNKATSLATKDYIVYLHNDIVLAPGFLENLEKHVSQNRVVSYTTIEPPIFAGHERPGKIIYDLGSDLETFNLEKLYTFVNEKQIEYKDKTEQGITFFMCMPREKCIEIGGLDNLFNPYFCEDDDLILRWKLLGMELVTSLDSICYHFVSKTSRFSEEYKTLTQQFETQSNRNFIRKWGFRNSIYNKKYNIAFVVKTCNLEILQLLEPWCDRIYIEDDMQVLTDSYIEKEQPTTKYDLNKRVFCVGYNDPEAENDIVIEFDTKDITQQSFNIIQMFSDIISESGEVGTFKLDCFKIQIIFLETYEKNLIKVGF